MQDLTKLKETIEAGLTDSTKEVFESVSNLECIKDLILCGGTGISIQLNHRLSEDLDFELIGTRKERPQLDFGGILREIKGVFPDAQEELLGSDHFLVFISDRKVKLSFFRPENPVKTMEMGLKYNNLKAPSLQDLLGMKVQRLLRHLQPAGKWPEAGGGYELRKLLVTPPDTLQGHVFKTAVTAVVRKGRRIQLHVTTI